MKNKDMKLKLWASQGLIQNIEDCGFKADITEEEFEKMLEISREIYGELARNEADLMVDNQALLREILDEVLGGK